MRAALKGTAIDAVLYTGIDDLGGFPGWFCDIVFERSYFTADGSVHYGEMEGMEDTWIYQVLDPYKSVVMRNRVESILLTTFETFRESFYMLGNNYAALKEDCVEYFIFEGETVGAGTPDWLVDLIDDDYLIVDHNPVRLMHFDDRGKKILISPNSVFVKNNRGQVTFMDQRSFYNIYETGQSKLYEDRLKMLSYIK